MRAEPAATTVLLPAATRAQSEQLRALRQARARQESGLLLVEGPRLLREALEAGLSPRLVGATPAAAAEHAGLLAQARRLGAVLAGLDERRAARLGDAVTGQGLLAAVPRPPAWDGVAPPHGPVLLPALAGLQDPGNVGGLLRSARAFGAAGALLLPGCADAGGPKVLRASAGAALRLPVTGAADLNALLALARDGGLTVLAAAAPAAGGRPLDELPARTLLLLGHETRGLPALPGVAAVAVPQDPAVDSLNVVVAGSVLMAAWYRRHHAAGSRA